MSQFFHLNNQFEFEFLRNQELRFSYIKINRYKSLINGRTAIAGAIIGLLLVFYNSKNLNCIGALSFFKMCSHIFMIFEVKLE